MARVTEMPEVRATHASANPPIVLPRVSACDRNECMVARTSLVTRRFTQTTLTGRVTLKATPPTRSTPAAPMSASGAHGQQDQSGGTDEAGERIGPSRHSHAVDPRFDEAQRDDARRRGRRARVP